MLAVGLAFDDEFVAGGDEPVDGGLCEQRVAHHAEPLGRVAVLVISVEVLRCRSTTSS